MLALSIICSACVHYESRRACLCSNSRLLHSVVPHEMEIHAIEPYSHAHSYFIGLEMFVCSLLSSIFHVCSCICSRSQIGHFVSCRHCSNNIIFFLHDVRPSLRAHRRRIFENKQTFIRIFLTVFNQLMHICMYWLLGKIFFWECALDITQTRITLVITCLSKTNLNLAYCYNFIL